MIFFRKLRKSIKNIEIRLDLYEKLEFNSLFRAMLTK